MSTRVDTMSAPKVTVGMAVATGLIATALLGPPLVSSFWNTGAVADVRVAPGAVPVPSAPVPVFAVAGPVSVAMAEVPDQPAKLAPGDGLIIEFDQPVALDPTFSMTLTDGTGVGVLDSSNTSATSAPDGKTILYRLAGAPRMFLGASLSGVNLEVLGQSGVSAASGPWNLVVSGQVKYVTSELPLQCIPVHARVFGGTNCLGFGSAGYSGPNPPDIFDVIARPTFDLPGSTAVAVNHHGIVYSCVSAGCDAAPEVITNCNGGSTSTIFDATSGHVLGAEPCGTWGRSSVPGSAWSGMGNELEIGNSADVSLDYVATPLLTDFDVVAASETVAGSLWVSGTTVALQITSLRRVSSISLQLDYDAPVTCPDPSRLGDGDAALEAAQFMWYDKEGKFIANHRATSVHCDHRTPGAVKVDFAGGIPSGAVFFKFDGYGHGVADPSVLLIPTGTVNGALGGQREVSQSFRLGPH